MDIFLSVTQFAFGEAVPEGTVIDPDSFQEAMNPISNGLALIALTTTGVPVAFKLESGVWHFIIKGE